MSPQRIEPLDRELADQAQERLRNSPYAELRTVTCVYEAGILRLCGAVPRYYLKQHAYRVVADLKGVRRIENNIVVGPRSETNPAAKIGAA